MAIYLAPALLAESSELLFIWPPLFCWQSGLLLLQAGFTALPRHRGAMTVSA